jgi:hypothetical protein
MSSPTGEEERLTKTQRREEARTQRKELEAAEVAGAARRKRLTLIGGALGVLVVLAVVAIIATSGGGGSQTVASGSGASAGLQTTHAPWAPELSALATRLQALKLPIQNDGAYHVHAVLRVYVEGRQVPVPANIGIDPQAGSMASTHTHDATGLVHIEASERYPFTLGTFFTVWGVKFTNTQLGGYLAGKGNVLSAYVNGKPVSNPAGYVMNPHDDIVVAYGKPGSFPTSFQYDWAAAGL